jgi:ribonuclease E
VHSLEQAKALALQPATAVPPIEEEEDEGDYDDEETPESEDAAVGAQEEGAQDAGEEAQAAGEPGQGRKRRRRRRGRRGGEGHEAFPQERDEFPPGEVADFAPAPAEHDLARSGQAQEAGDGSGAERPAEAHGDGERRRRRRGRRGGRRNRRGRDGESFAMETSPEPDLANAAHDLDRALPIAAAEPPAAPIAGPEAHAEPFSEPRGDVQPPAAAPPQEAPLPQIASPTVPETTASEPPRRRSTVREPAPQALRDDASSPAPPFTAPEPPIEPVVSSSAESDDSDRPRRSGWWSKRVLGKS